MISFYEILRKYKVRKLFQIICEGLYNLKCVHIYIYVYTSRAIHTQCTNDDDSQTREQQREGPTCSSNRFSS